MPWDVLLPRLHSQCFTQPLWLFHMFLTLTVCMLTVGALNLVIDASFKSGMGNEETQSYQVLGSQEVE